MVVAYRLTKMCHCIPCTTYIDAEQNAKQFVANIFKLYGLPVLIILEEGPQFAAWFFKQLCIWLKINNYYLTVYYPL